MIRFAPRLLLTFVAFITVLSLSPGSASAHNTLVSSTPRNGAVLSSSPSQWVLTFDKSVPLASASGEIVKEDGVRVPLSSPQHGESDKIVVFNLPKSLTGSNTARWRLVGTDGHVISGRVSFSIGTSTSPSSTTPATILIETTSKDDSSPLLPPSRMLLRVISYLSLLLLIGALFSDRYISPGLLLSDLSSRVVSISAYGLATSALLQCFLFISEARTPGSGFIGGTIDAISSTPGSMTVMKALTGGLLAGMLSGRFMKTTPTNRLVNFTLFLFLLTFAYGGHSRSEAAPWLGIPVNMIHIVAISAWLGGLGILVFLIVPKMDTSSALMAFRQFGFLAERSVAVLSLTGIIQLLRMYPNPFTVFTSAHGLLLVIKIVIVVGMVYLAARNRTSLLSLIENNSRQQRITRRHIMKFSLIEICLGTAVLFVTALVVGVSPT